MSRMPERLQYILITPARNEEANIERLIQCVVAQTQLPLRWVIVNDGSTDSTAVIVNRHAARYPWIELVEMPRHRDRSFAAKAHSFKAGYERVQGLDWDIVVNVDADISFEPDYFEFLVNRFADEPRLGVAGTIFTEGSYSSDTNSFEGHQHVAGGAQMFRRRCFEDIGGYVPNKAGGVDWIAVTSARMKGWQTRSYREKSFFHHRPLGTAERGPLASAFSYGEKDYYLGNAPAWQIFRVVYQCRNRPYFLVGAAVALGYLSAALRRIDRPVSPELMRFHRGEQMLKLKAILKSLLQFKRVDSFQVIPR
jgi:glycosyltransferase involved in cell wall biosynthesis